MLAADAGVRAGLRPATAGYPVRHRRRAQGAARARDAADGHRVVLLRRGPHPDLRTPFGRPGGRCRPQRGGARRARVGGAAAAAHVHAGEFPDLGPIRRKYPWRRSLGFFEDLGEELLKFLPLVSGAELLCFVPHGPLHGLPLHALPDGDGGYLVERTGTVYAPSISSLSYVLRPSPLRPNGRPPCTRRGSRPERITTRTTWSTKTSCSRGIYGTSSGIAVGGHQASCAAVELRTSYSAPHLPRLLQRAVAPGLRAAPGRRRRAALPSDGSGVGTRAGQDDPDGTTGHEHVLGRRDRRPPRMRPAPSMPCGTPPTISTG